METRMGWLQKMENRKRQKLAESDRIGIRSRRREKRVIKIAGGKKEWKEFGKRRRRRWEEM